MRTGLPGVRTQVRGRTRTVLAEGRVRGFLETVSQVVAGSISEEVPSHNTGVYW